VLKLTDDGALAEFGSAVDAAAIEFQPAVAYVSQDQRKVCILQQTSKRSVFSAVPDIENVSK
jgi:hypothetical protein